MQLHRLTMQAIGPFAGRVDIDFSAVTQSGVFLLDGPTGAGKSTIIDAIVFALYGKPAGSDSSDERLRSHHAEPSVGSYVELLFETNAGIFRIHRSPAYRRAKKNGKGTTPQNAKASLARVTSPDDLEGGVAMSSSAAEIGGEIRRIVGLTREQFAQTVVLPQGEFAAFLRSSGEQRRDVLESIFQTQLYDQITKYLVQDRIKAANERKEAVTRIDTAAAVFAAAATRDGVVPDGLDERDDVVALRTRCSGIVAEFEAKRAEQESAHASAVRAQQAATVALTEQRELDARLARRAELLGHRAALDEQAPSIDADRDRMALAVRASGARATIAASALAEADMGTATEALAQAREDFGAGADDQTVAGLAQSNETLVARLAVLRGLLDLEQGFCARDEAIAAQDGAIADLRTDIEAAETARAERPALRDTLDVAVADATAASHAVAPARRTLADAEKTLATVLERERLGQHLADLETRLREAVAEAQSAVDHEHDLRRRKLAGMAGELAGALKDESPCPVCGSRQHPHPASTSADHPGDDEIDAAERRRIALEGAAGDLETERTVAQGLLDVAVAAHDMLSVVEARDGVRAAGDSLDAVSEQAQQLDTLTAQLSDFDRAAQEQEHALQQLRLDLTRTTESRRAAAESLAADRATVAATHQGKAADLRELVDAVTAEHHAGKQLRAALDRAERARAERDKRAEERDKALAESGFDSSTAAQAAMLDAEAMANLKRAIAQHDQTRTVVDAGLGAPDIAGLSGDEHTDIDGAAEVEAAARATVAEAGRRLNITNDRVSQLVRHLASVRAAIDANDTLISSSAPVMAMADLADGSSKANRLRMTLGSYVLIRRFEEVVKAANSRLGPMSSGRYQLERSDAIESHGGRRTGLSLRILDNATGKVREPKAFSGGETFYTSLCLALGLADVVMGEAGGIDLGTLFVDEGFGSLDSETLDIVMSELGKLSSAGRTVGIVSHVEELKSRVSDRITVAHNADGTSRLTVHGNDR